MRPEDVKSKIKILKESLERNRALVKWHAKWIDSEYFEGRVNEQQKIIDDAQAKIDEMTEHRYNAVLEVGKIERSDKHRRKEILKLQHMKKILQIQALAEKIRDTRKSK